VRLIGEGGHVRAVELERVAADEAGRPVATGELFVLQADMVFKAIGQRLVPDALNGSAELLEFRNGKVVVNEDRRTSLAGVWAGGDATGLGMDLTVVAVEDGKVAARAMHRYLTA
jgi:glutamate synthase (NADPH/NADH) small chain